MTRDLEAVMIQIPVQNFAALPHNHDIRHLVRQVVFIGMECADRQKTPLLLSQKIVQLLYKTPTQLGRDVYVTLLDQLCRTYEDVGKEAINWLLYAEDEVCLPICFLFPEIHSSAAQIQCTGHRHAPG